MVKGKDEPVKRPPRLFVDKSTNKFYVVVKGERIYIPASKLQENNFKQQAKVINNYITQKVRVHTKRKKQNRKAPVGVIFSRPTSSSQVPIIVTNNVTGFSPQPYYVNNPPPPPQAPQPPVEEQPQIKSDKFQIPIEKPKQTNTSSTETQTHRVGFVEPTLTQPFAGYPTTISLPQMRDLFSATKEFQDTLQKKKDLSKKASEDFANYNLQQRLKKKENPPTSELLQTPIKKENPLTSELLQSGLKGLKKKQPIEPLPTNKPLSLQEELQLKVKNPNLKKSTETVAPIKLPTLADEIAYQRANLRKVENGIEAPKSKKQTNESLPPLMELPSQPKQSLPFLQELQNVFNTKTDQQLLQQSKDKSPYNPFGGLNVFGNIGLSTSNTGRRESQSSTAPVAPVAPVPVGAIEQQTRLNKDALMSELLSKYHTGNGKYSSWNDGITDIELERIMNDKLHKFVPVIMADEIPSLERYITPKTKIFGFIVNTDPSTESGTHWYSVFIDFRKSTVEIFDSLATPPSKGLISGLKQLMRSLSRPLMFKVKWNHNVVQDAASSNDCGFHAASFLIKRYHGHKVDMGKRYTIMTEKGQAYIDKFKEYL
jgi:hypothetical protein